MANTVEEARVKARKKLLEDLDSYSAEIGFDEEDKLEIISKGEWEIGRDIAKEPGIVESGVVIIQGSD